MVFIQNQNGLSVDFGGDDTEPAGTLHSDGTRQNPEQVV